jgi:hypothetical protein
MLNAQQIQAIHNRREQINAAVAACLKIYMAGRTPRELIKTMWFGPDVPLCTLPDVSPERWRAMILHVWRNYDIYSPPNLLS